MSWEDIFKLDENKMSLKGLNEVNDGFQLLVAGIATLADLAIATDNEELKRMLDGLMKDAEEIGRKTRGIVAVIRQRDELS